MVVKAEQLRSLAQLMKTADTMSVVIPTKDRPEELARTLQTLAKQTVLPSELILVDQSRAQTKIGDLPFPVTHVYDTQIRGAAQARNRALDLVTSTYILFLDDDVDLEPDFIAQILATYAEHPEADGVSGVITNYSPPPLWRHLHDRMFRLGPFYDERQPIYWNADKLRSRGPIRVSKFTGCLMSFRRSCIGELRFNDSVPGASFEDSDFCYALGSSVLLIAPRARLVHVKTSTARENVHWVKLETSSAYYYFVRHADRHRPLNWLIFAWLNIGLFVLAAGSAARRGSLQPFRELRSGARIGRELAIPGDSLDA